MKYVFSLILPLVLSIFCSAQKVEKIPDFGKVDKSDLLLKECDFDKAAEALVLFDVAQVYCSFYPNSVGDPVSSEVVRHVRIKILNDKGLSQANINIPFYSYGNAENVKNISAQTYSLDPGGNIVITKVEKSLIYDKKLNKRFSQKIFTFPQVKPGSIIEFKYTKQSDGFGGLSNWYFQKSIPVKLSQYTINFPEEFEVSATPYCILPYDIKSEKKNSRDIKIYSMNNIPALRDEPFITTEDDYLQRIEPRIIAINSPVQRFPLTRSWPSVIKILMEDEDFGVQLKKEIPRTSELDLQLKALNDPYQKMITIFYYVRKNMEWNGYDNIWALDGIKSAWKDKKGTSGEINLILVNLLKDADLKAHPVLVSTRENGMVNTSIADINQFDKVLAYVELNDKVYVLDATDKYTPPNLIPLEVMYSEGLVIEKPLTFEWGWKVLWNEKNLYRNTVMVQAELKDGEMKGSVNVYSMDYSRIVRTEKLKSGKDKYLEEFYSSSNPGIKIDSFNVQNEDVDSLPLIQKFLFNQPVASSGDYTYFKTNMFSGMEKNIFVSDNRFSDVFFGANQTYSIIGNFSIPDGYAFDELPKNIRMIMSDTSIIATRVSAIDGNKLSSRISLQFKKPMYSTEEYPDFREFYKRLYDLLNEQIVLKKKTNP